MGYLRVQLFGQISVVVYSGDSIFIYKLSATEIGKKSHYVCKRSKLSRLIKNTKINLVAMSLYVCFLIQAYLRYLSLFTQIFQASFSSKFFSAFVKHTFFSRFSLSLRRFLPCSKHSTYVLSQMFLKFYTVYSRCCIICSCKELVLIHTGNVQPRDFSCANVPLIFQFQNASILEIPKIFTNIFHVPSTFSLFVQKLL